LRAHKISSQGSKLPKYTNLNFFITKVKFNKEYKNKLRMLPQFKKKLQIFKVDVLHRGQRVKIAKKEPKISIKIKINSC
jgi:hypothetical protein